MADGNPVVILRLTGDVPLSALYRGRLEKLLKPGHTLRANSDGSGLEDDAYLPPFSDAEITDGQLYTYEASSGLLVPTDFPTSGNVFPYQADGTDSTVITNTTTETAFDTTTWSLDGDSLAVGDRIRVEASGLATSLGLNSDQLTIRLRANTSNLLASVGMVNPTGGSNQYFHFQADIIVRSIGASGVVATDFKSRVLTNAVATSSNRVTLTIDTESTINFSVTGQWSHAAGSNNARVHSSHWTLYKKAAA